MSANTDNSRSQQLNELYLRHAHYIKWLHENEMSGPLAGILTRSGPAAMAAGTCIDLYNPRDVEHFVLGAMWLANAVMEGTLEALSGLVGEHAYASLMNGISTDLATICEGLQQYLPQVGREH